MNCIVLYPSHTSGSLSITVEKKHAFVGDLVMNLGLLTRFFYIPAIAKNLKDIYLNW